MENGRFVFDTVGDTVRSQSLAVGSWGTWSSMEVAMTHLHDSCKSQGFDRKIRHVGWKSTVRIQ